jgi:hypothetical protein
MEKKLCVRMYVCNDVVIFRFLSLSYDSECGLNGRMLKALLRQLCLDHLALRSNTQLSNARFV